MPQKSMGTTLSCTHQNTSTAIGLLRSIGEIKMDSEAVDVTTLDAENGCKSFIQGYKDPGEVTVEGFYEKNNAGQSKLRALYGSGEAVPFTVTFPDASSVTFTAFVKSIAMGAASVDGAIGFSAVLKLTGGVTVA